MKGTLNLVEKAFRGECMESRGESMEKALFLLLYYISNLLKYDSYK